MSSRVPSILIVDDEIDACANLADILGEQGFHIGVVHDGQAALERLRKTPYDVALLDLMMPGMDGLTLYREIRKLRPGTVAIMVTALTSRAASGKADGIWKVVPKPVDIPALLALVTEALSQPLTLVVDDDCDLCRNLWDLLRERGYRVCIAHDETAAAERLSGSNYNVVLIDMKLPAGDGQGVFRRVKKTNPEAFVIAMTGYRSESEDVLQQMLAEGANAICYKPFDVAELLNTIDRLATAGFLLSGGR